MAIDYIDIQPMSRTNGANAVEAAAYRSNSKMYDEQLGQVFDYTNKKDCVYANVMLPETAFSDELDDYGLGTVDVRNTAGTVEIQA